MTLITEPQTETRALATVETIAEIHPIPDADAIERARVRGWDVVIKKGEFAVGDLAVYFEVDSHLDTTDPRYEFLAPRGIRTNEDGFTGHVLKTAKLRGTYSQGLVLPVGQFPELDGAVAGDNVTGQLGVIKWDPPIPADLAGQLRGAFPSAFPKTDEERIQNITAMLDVRDVEWVATEKLDGTSMTLYVEGDYDGVAGRNWDLSYDGNHSMWRIAGEKQLHAQLRAAFPGSKAAIQGELFGAGIQGNPLQVKEARFAAFTVIVDGKELPRNEWPGFVTDVAVPVYDFTYPETLDEALAQVETLKSLVSPGRAAEGVVWRAPEAALVKVGDRYERASWKAISRKYLMKADR